MSLFFCLVVGLIDFALFRSFQQSMAQKEVELSPRTLVPELTLRIGLI
jgi:hypothetical protein